MSQRITALLWGVVALFFWCCFTVNESRARSHDLAGCPYEDAILEQAFASTGLEIEPHPGGKTIEKIVIVRFPVVTAQDPWPAGLNLFHVTTKEHIVRQELLFHEGQIFDRALVEESARNLRAMPMIFSVVQIVAAKGSDSNKVIVMVVTKDLWSIRLNTSFNYGGGVFDFVSFLPTEQNLLGLNQQLSLYFKLDRDVLTLGQVFRVPRLLGTRKALTEALAVRLNRDSSAQEGGFGWISLEKPLFSLSSRFTWRILLFFDKGIRRYYKGSAVRRVKVQSDPNLFELPHNYEFQSLSGEARLGLSFGSAWKTEAFAGYRAQSKTYDLAVDTSSLPEAVTRAYRDIVLPGNDEFAEIFGRIVLYQAKYLKTSNIDTYGLTEDFRLGPFVAVTASHASPLFGFHQYSATISVEAGNTSFILGDLARFAVSYSARWWPRNSTSGSGSPWMDKKLEFTFYNASPMFIGWFRLVSSLRFTSMDSSRALELVSIGGSKGLRGYPSDFRLGTRCLSVNVEARTRPFVWRTLHYGFVLFYDGGDAWMHERDVGFDYLHSIGIGLRALFPQFDKGVVRLDLGFPLDRAPKWSSIVAFSYLQAF